jgi:hypothetical protein
VFTPKDHLSWGRVCVCRRKTSCAFTPPTIMRNMYTHTQSIQQSS